MSQVFFGRFSLLDFNGFWILMVT